jgi:ribosome-binding ATPase
MALEVGIVGLPNAGKSTLFNALLGREVARAQNYPFCTIDPNTGVVEVPDERLGKLAKVENSREIIPAAVKFVDIAGLVEGAAKGEGLGNKFLSHIREVDLICYVLRNFQDENVERAGSVNPQSDLETLKTELILKDLETIGKITAKRPNANDKDAATRYRLAKKVEKILEEGLLPINQEWDEQEEEMLRGFFLLTAKTYMIVLNIDEEDFSQLDKIKTDFAGWEVVPICAKIEAELAQLSLDERKEYLSSLGVERSGLEFLIKQAYNRLGLISFYTAGEKEARAWTVAKGTMAPEAAGVIHTDFEKNFIKAEVVDYQDFIQFGGWAKCRSLGKTEFKGQNYQFVGDEVVEFKVGT